MDPVRLWYAANVGNVKIGAGRLHRNVAALCFGLLSVFAFTSTAVFAVCGDGILEGGEECDPGGGTFIDGNPSNPACATGGTCFFALSCCKFNCQFVGQGASCFDGNPCTEGDVCGNVGQCEGTVVANGGICDDDSACTSGETCQSGVCGAPTSTVICSALSECHDVGICDPGTGICSDPPKPSGSLCTDDGNPCTTDVCDGGGTCAHPAGNAGAVCRAAASPCDVAETCTGTDTLCPPDNDPTCTPTSTPTFTPTATPTETPTSTPTSTPTATPTPTPTATPTSTSTATPTSTPTSTPTFTPIPPDLAISASHGGSFTVGVNGTYTIATTNVGAGSTVGTITVTDNLPTGLGFVSGTGGGWSCAAAGQLVTCTSSDVLAPAASTSIILTVTVGSAALPSVTNSVTVGTTNDTNAANNSATDPTSVNPAPGVELAMTKSHSGDFNDGSDGVYTLAVTNLGLGSSTGTITVTDTLPTGLAYVSAAGAGWACSAAGQLVTCTNAGPLVGGGGTSITLTVHASSTAVPSVTNSATVATSGDADPTNDTDTDLTTVRGTVDLTISKSHSASFKAGTNGTYLLTVTNIGSASSIGTITVEDPLPAGLSFVSATGVGWSCTAVVSSVSCTKTGPLSKGASSTITLTVGVSAPAVPSVTNTVTVTNANDSNSANDSASDVTSVNPAPTSTSTRTPTRTAIPTATATPTTTLASTPTETVTPTAGGLEVTPTPTATLASGSISTATPTPLPGCAPPAPSSMCNGPNRLRLRWSARSPQSLGLYFSTTHCGIHAGCGSVATLGSVTAPPLTLSIADAAGTVLLAQIIDPVLHQFGCMGGSESYRGTSGKVRFVFGRDGQTTLIVNRRIAAPAAAPVALVGPVRITIVDACGHIVEGSVLTCYTSQSTTMVKVDCSQI